MEIASNLPEVENSLSALLRGSCDFQSAGVVELYEEQKCLLFHPGRQIENLLGQLLSIHLQVLGIALIHSLRQVLILFHHNNMAVVMLVLQNELHVGASFLNSFVHLLKTVVARYFSRQN